MGVVLVSDIAEQRSAQAVECGHLWEIEVPCLVTRSVDVWSVQEGSMFIEPIDDRVVFLLVQLQLNGLQGLDILNVLRVGQRWLLVIEGGESHALEVATIALLLPHRNPHGCPLCVEDRLDDSRDLVDECQTSVGVVEDLDVSSGLPGHRHILQKLQHSVGHELQRTQITALICSKLLLRHIADIPEHFAQMFGRQVCLLCLHESSLALLAEPLALLTQPVLLLLRVLGHLGIVHLPRAGRA